MRSVVVHGVFQAVLSLPPEGFRKLSHEISRELKREKVYVYQMQKLVGNSTPPRRPTWAGREERRCARYTTQR